MGGPTRSYSTASIALRIIDHPIPTTTSQYGYLQGVTCYLLMKIKVFFLNERCVDFIIVFRERRNMPDGGSYC
jgi:hypothetical protein